MASVGTSGTSCDSENPWELLERSGAMSTVTATPDGKLWVYVGGDSGFEGSTTLYYDRVELTLTPL